MSDLPVEPWTPPALKKILNTAEEDYNHPSFGLDDLLVMLRDAYGVGAKAGRPFVAVDPAMRFGRPTVNNTRLSVEAATEHVWAGGSVGEVAEEFDVTRQDVLVACWYAGKYGTKAWRRRWGKWADVVHDELWHSRYDVPDPPDLNDEQ
jgi:uncharacterized protein (DUF433 family)